MRVSRWNRRLLLATYVASRPAAQPTAPLLFRCPPPPPAANAPTTIARFFYRRRFLTPRCYRGAAHLPLCSARFLGLKKPHSPNLLRAFTLRPRHTIYGRAAATPPTLGRCLCCISMAFTKIGRAPPPSATPSVPPASCPSAGVSAGAVCWFSRCTRHRTRFGTARAPWRDGPSGPSLARRAGGRTTTAIRKAKPARTLHPTESTRTVPFSAAGPPTDSGSPGGSAMAPWSRFVTFPRPHQPAAYPRRRHRPSPAWSKTALATARNPRRTESDA